MKLSRRGWNNVIIVAVVIFIAMIQLPDLIKARLAPSSSSSPSVLQSLLPESAIISRLVLPDHVLTPQDGEWTSEPEVSTSPQKIVEHWQTISGTFVDDEMMAKLKPQLNDPRTVEVWLQSAEEPVRVTVYQQPQFWLLSSWQGVWLAISVEESYLFPTAHD